MLRRDLMRTAGGAALAAPLSRSKPARAEYASPPGSAALSGTAIDLAIENMAFAVNGRIVPPS
jgi:hypothetical protein